MSAATAPEAPPASSTYTIAEAAALTGLHKNTVRLRVKLGQLEAQVRQGKFGVEYRIPHSALVRAGLLEGSPEDGATPGLESCALIQEQLGSVPDDETPAADSEDTGGEWTPIDSLPTIEPAADAGLAGSLTELYQRHEQAMFRLGFMQSELDRVKALAADAESVRRDRQESQLELEQLRRQLDEAREQAKSADTLRAELETAQQRLREAEDLRRILSDVEQEAQRLRVSVEESRQPWWRRFRQPKQPV